jgi:prevent-host-death family protein
MKVKSVAEVKARFSEFLSIDSGPVLVTRNGRPAGVLVPIAEDSDIEDLALSFSPKFRAIMQRAEEQIRSGQTYSLEETRKILESNG